MPSRAVRSGCANDAPAFASLSWAPAPAFGRVGVEAGRTSGMATGKAGTVSGNLRHGPGPNPGLTAGLIPGP